MKKIYDFSVRTLGGQLINIEEYKGKVLLIVNTASKCGFAFQLKGLDQLHRQFYPLGFSVLAFPSDSFRGQEYKDNQSIEKFCVFERGLSYPIFERVSVKGPQAHPIFQYLANGQENGLTDAPPVWNYHKYLFNRQGKLVATFKPWVPANSWFVKSKIKKLITNDI